MQSVAGTQAPLFYEGRQPTAVALAQRINGDLRITCSGVPITQNIVLTAAHCLLTRESTAMPISIVTHESAETIPAVRWIIHPRFKDSPRARQEDFDLALVETAGRAAQTNEPLQQPQSNENPKPDDNARLWILGFSPIRLRLSKPTDILRSPSAWSSIQLQNLLPLEGKFSARASKAHRAAACAGDSGAPVWKIDHTGALLKGIVVQANCEQGEVKSIDVQHYKEWISASIQRLSLLAPRINRQATDCVSMQGRNVNRQC